MSHGGAQIRVVIVEPSAIVSSGLREVISSSADLEVADSLGDLSLLSEQRLERLEADVILINPSVVDYSQRDKFRSTWPALTTCPLVAITYDHFDEEYLRRFDAVVGIGSHPSALIQRLRSVAAEEDRVADDERGNELSAREKDILVAVASGATNKEIADRLNLSVHTVVTHRKNISRKLGIRTISGLTVYAIMNNLIEVG